MSAFVVSLSPQVDPSALFALFILFLPMSFRDYSKTLNSTGTIKKQQKAKSTVVIVEHHVVADLPTPPAPPAEPAPVLPPPKGIETVLTAKETESELLDRLLRYFFLSTSF